MSDNDAKCSSNIPVVDFGPFMVEEGVVVNEMPTAGQRAVAHAIDQACREHGFLYLTNFGLSPQDRLQAFAASRELFAMPDHQKKSLLRRLGVTDNMGYAPYQSESHNPARPPELSEKFNIRFPPAHQNDMSHCPPNFIEVCDMMRDMMKRAARHYALACALALGVNDPTFIARTLEKMNQCTIRFLHAPPCDYYHDSSSTREEHFSNLNVPLRVNEHTDFGAFTFLLLGDGGDAQGFQFQPVEGGEITDWNDTITASGWKDLIVPDNDNTKTVGAIVNTGALMARWTNDEWKATAHRVVVPSAEMGKRHRYSVAFFADPDVGSVIDVPDELLVPTKDGFKKKKLYSPTTSDAYLLEKLSSMGRGEHPVPTMANQ